MYRFNPFTQTFDRTEKTETLESSKKLQIFKIASEDLVVGDVVSMDGNSSCSKCSNTTEENSSVIGICVSNALQGENVEILISGIFEDAKYSSIPFGVSVFQTSNGSLSVDATDILGRFFTRVGKSYGDGLILVRPEEPVEVSA